MHGNVWEWCQDCYDKDYYSKSAKDDPRSPGGSIHVFRGGSWVDPARVCRSAFRNDYGGPGSRHCHLGFRVSQVLADTVAERAKMSPTTDAVHPSDGSTSNKPSPAIASPDAQSPIRFPAVVSLRGPDGKWKLPPGAPAPAITPFDGKKAKEYQEAWAKHLAVPVEVTNSIGMKLVLIPPGEFQMGSADGGKTSSRFSALCIEWKRAVRSMSFTFCPISPATVSIVIPSPPLTIRA